MGVNALKVKCNKMPKTSNLHKQILNAESKIQTCTKKQCSKIINNTKQKQQNAKIHQYCIYIKQIHYKILDIHLKFIYTKETIQQKS